MLRDLVGHLSAQKGWECRSLERYVDYWLWVLMAFTMKSWEVGGMLIHCTSLHSGRKRKRILPHTAMQVHLPFGPSPLTSLSGDHLLTSAVHLSYTHAMTFDIHNPYLKKHTVRPIFKVLLLPIQYGYPQKAKSLVIFYPVCTFFTVRPPSTHWNQFLRVLW